jgi:hypothetical protein
MKMAILLLRTITAARLLQGTHLWFKTLRCLAAMVYWLSIVNIAWFIGYQL